MVDWQISYWYTQAHVDTALVTCVLSQNQMGNSGMRGTCIQGNELCWECAFLLSHTQHKFQCQTPSNVWTGACSEFGQVSSASAWSLPPLVWEGELPWYRDNCNTMHRLRAFQCLFRGPQAYSSQSTPKSPSPAFKRLQKSATLPVQFLATKIHTDKDSPVRAVMQAFLHRRLRKSPTEQQQKLQKKPKRLTLKSPYVLFLKSLNMFHFIRRFMSILEETIQFSDKFYLYLLEPEDKSILES